MKDFQGVLEELHKEKKEQDVVKINKMKAKVLAVGRMAVMLRGVRENKDLITKAKMELGTNKLPAGLLAKIKGDYNNLDDFISKYRTDQ